MDNLTKKLLSEVARTVLRVLGESETRAALPSTPTPPSTPVPTHKTGKKSADTLPALPVSQTPPAPLKSQPSTYAPIPPPLTLNVKRGDFVRFWDGNRYAVGRVQGFGRGKNAGKVNVRIERDQGQRGKTHCIDGAKLIVVRAADGRALLQ